jgi:signal transduction histidine kinase/CheY-like chemotaxis protein
MSDLQQATQTNQDLRRCLRDLPAIWIGHELSRVVDSLAEVLHTLLDLELVYIRIGATDNTTHAHTARGKSKNSHRIDPLSVSHAIEAILADESLSPVIDHPTTGLPLHAAITRFGYGSQTGILVTAASRDNFPIEAERLLLGLAANQAAVLLARHQSEARLREEAKVIELVNQVGAAVAAELDLQKLVQLVTDTARALSGAPFGAFLYNLKSHRAQSHSLNAVSGASRQALESFASPANNELLAPTFRGEGIIRLDDLTADPRYSKTVLSPGHLPLRSYLAVPVIARSADVIGGLFLGHPHPGIFTSRHERIIRGIAAHAAVAIDNARLYEAQQKARAEAEAANQAKNNFLGILSHELRTPMTPVLLTVSMLERRTDLPPDIIADLNSIHRNVVLESKLIDDLLDLTRISRGKFQLNFQTTDIHLIIRSAIDICRQKAGPRILTHLDAQCHHVSGDPARLQQIFWNLLNNANKFTPPDGSITVCSRNDAVGDIVIEVSDTGIGINPDVLPRIFNAFEQGEVATARRFGGLGLGLAICKALADAQQITLTAASCGAGQGATFKLQMPSVPSPHVHTTDLPPTAAPNVNQKTLRVLIVEDHEPTHQVLGKLLHGLGHIIQVATTVSSALEIAQRADLDLVISDVGLPDGTGHELMRTLKQRFGLAGIALSGYGADGDIRKSFDAGFLAHLTKPIDLRRLEDAIAIASTSQNLAAKIPIAR